MEWHIISASVRGASHIRDGLPNQDAIRWHSDSGLPIIMAVSDGHGSRKSFRSDRGAGFAVETALETMKAFVISQSGDNLTIVKRIAEEQIPKEIVKRWKQSVKADIRGCKDLECVADSKQFIAYGATLMTVLLTESFMICFQIGDGDILTVWENDEVERPVPEDERLFANETTSLCTEKAWRDFRFRFQRFTDSPPKLILMATDGYANSFRDDESFMKVASDIWHMIESEGPNFIKQNLGNWLNEASQAGSGDDITVGLICWQNTEALREDKHFRIPLWIACPV